MKTCPYCAEEIKDAAIRCRWCQTWLVETVPAGAEGPPPKMAERKSGSREPQATMVQPVPSDPKPPQPVATEAKPAEPAAIAQTTPAAQPPPAAAPAAAQPPPTSQPAAAAQSTPAAQAPAADAKIEFTHTGSRYLLGYGADYFGVWDRNAPQQPLERFPRNDQGWAAAWARYASIENNWMDLRTGQKSG